MFNVTTIFWVRSRTQGKSNNNNNNMSTHKGYTKRHRQAKIFLMLFVGSLFCLLFEMMLNADLGEKREREKNVGWTHKKNHVSRSHSCWWYTQRMMIFFSVSRTIFFCTHIFLVDSKEDRKLFKNAKSIKIMRENGKIFLWSKVRSVDWSLLNFNLNEIKLL